MRKTIDRMLGLSVPLNDGATKIHLPAVLASAVMFFLNGAIFGSWVSRIPAIQTNLSLDAGPLGLAILAQGSGALLSMRSIGRLSGTYGSGPVTFISFLLQCLSLALISTAANIWQLTLALGFFGACGGAMEVGMNAHAVAVQRQLARPILSRLHALWSVGGMFGATAGAIVAKLGIQPQEHFAIASVLFILAGFIVRDRFFTRTQEFYEKEIDGQVTLTHVSDSSEGKALLLWCIICFLAFAGEGAIADWSGLYIEHSLKTDPGFAALGFACFSSAMALGRFGGDLLIRWAGRNNLLRYGSLLTAATMAMLIAVARPWLAPIAFATAGFGLCTLVPIVYTCAGEIRSRQGSAT